MRLRDAAKWIKEKITGKKAEETPVLTPMIATEEDIERAKKMDREIEEMEKKSAILALYIAGMTLYFHYQLKDGRIKREYTEEQRRADEEQIQAIREMQARKEEKRQKRRQRKSEANRR